MPCGPLAALGQTSRISARPICPSASGPWDGHPPNIPSPLGRLIADGDAGTSAPPRGIQTAVGGYLDNLGRRSEVAFGAKATTCGSTLMAPEEAEGLAMVLVLERYLCGQSCSLQSPSFKDLLVANVLQRFIVRWKLRGSLFYFDWRLEKLFKSLPRKWPVINTTPDCL